MSISAIVENDTIKLPMHVPNGTRVEVVLLTETKNSDMGRFEAWLKASTGLVKGKFTTEDRMRETRGEN
jgi:hypothetical protein